MKKNSPAYVILFMAALSLVFGTGVAVVHTSTLRMTESNERLYRDRTIASAFNLPVNEQNAQGYERAIRDNLDVTNLSADGREWVVYTRKIAPHDVGFIFQGVGFWDVIRGVAVLTPDLGEIRRIAFLDQKETPGLGARIEESWFREQFEGYRLRWGRRDRLIAFGEEPPDGGKKVEAITGATQTSLALERILNQELQSFFKVYKQN
jgi:Na+-transporting NADH:ubiquinone oxidoreductase subunit C